MEEKDMNECNAEAPTSGDQENEDFKTREKSVIDELNNKYLRLYAEFDNYRKRVNKEKEELAKYGNESLIYELLPIIDSLELALKHAPEESQAGIVQGVEMTLKELHRTLEKFGVSRIEAAGKKFDPSIHHAMAQVEREDLEEKMVAEDLRAGYLYRDKVLRPSLVSVSTRKNAEKHRSGESCREVDTGTAEVPDEMRTDIHENIEEDQ